MITVTITTRRGKLDWPAIYKRGVWAVTHAVGSRYRPLKTRFVVTHVPTGYVCRQGLDPLGPDAAINLCRALGDEYPDFNPERVIKTESGAMPAPMEPDARKAMGARILELYRQVLAAQVAKPKLHTLRKP